MTGAWDVAFMPVDEQRKQKLDFGAAHIVLQSIWMAGAGVADPNAGRCRSTWHACRRRREHGIGARRARGDSATGTINFF
jgi:hypothetical protein